MPQPSRHFEGIAGRYVDKTEQEPLFPPPALYIPLGQGCWREAVRLGTRDQVAIILDNRCAPNEVHTACLQLDCQPIFEDLGERVRERCSAFFIKCTHAPDVTGKVALGHEVCDYRLYEYRLASIQQLAVAGRNKKERRQRLQPPRASIQHRTGPRT